MEWRKEDSVVSPAKNSDFRLDDSFGFLISRVKVRLSANLDAALTELDITHAQWVILVRIATGVARTGADLCRCSQYDTGSMTRMLDRLEEKGLIGRERSAEDRRIVQIHLTERGQVMIPQLLEIGGRVLDKMSRGFSADETVQCKALLRRMADNLADDEGGA